MEDMLHLIETPETSTLRLNADAISYLGNAFTEAEDVDIKLQLLAMMKKHSDFVLNTSDTIISRQRLHMKAVK
jgi:hypothetical protein